MGLSIYCGMAKQAIATAQYEGDEASAGEIYATGPGGWLQPLVSHLTGRRRNLLTPTRAALDAGAASPGVREDLVSRVPGARERIVRRTTWPLAPFGLRPNRTLRRFHGPFRWPVEAGGLTQPTRLTSHQLSAGTAASQKSSLRPVEPLTIPRSAKNSSSEGLAGVPPLSTRNLNRT
jgi:hypothetical protein